MRADLVISALFLILLAILVNPNEGLWMPSMAEEILVAALAVLFSLYAIYFWREKSADEREDLHRLFAGRIAFLAGAGFLTAGIALQAYRHALDPWLAYALGAMILSKTLARAWKERKG